MLLFPPMVESPGYGYKNVVDAFDGSYFLVDFHGK
jgi:hypothetical protein